mmetsp:Transcript_9234/g.16998  ORF Transcript_9234/g.16998 Transcript_9234/m.16998 type:complete len:383 (+) Transcript_9234:75-1223(+)
MSHTVSRTQQQAFRDLKLDDGFFLQMLMPMNEAEGDFDVYLMEKGVMPVLLQGLDALSKHVDKVATGTTMGSSKQKFNPLTWLAQYLLRNHPRLIQDHRTATYEHLMQLAEVERGRRNLLRKQGEFESAWIYLSQDSEHLSLEQIPSVIKKLDASWRLEGELVRRLSGIAQHIEAENPSKVTFIEFWQSFEALVNRSDLLRVSVFQVAARNKIRSENEAYLALQEQQQREEAVEDELRQRKLLQGRFETICADVYINSELSQIMGKATLAASPMEQKGEHVVLVLQLLRAWGYPVLDDDGDLVDQDQWDLRAKEVWRQWRLRHGPASRTPDLVDSDALKALIDKDAFQVHCRASQQGSTSQSIEEPPPPPPPPPPAPKNEEE